MSDASTSSISLCKEVTYPKYACLSSNGLKVIAMILMTVDHLAWTFQNADYSTQWWALLMHILGRIVAPIFWFMMAEGWHFTKNPKKYIIRLFIGVIISHFAYCLFTEQSFIPFYDGEGFTYWYETSVMWGLAWAAVALYLTDGRYFHFKKWVKALILIGLGIVSFPCDWASCGYVAILLIYKFRGSFWKQMLGMMGAVLIYAFCYVFVADLVYGILALCASLAIPFLRLYNGKPGLSKAMKGVYYLYYPFHLAVLGLVQMFFLA